MKLFHWHANKSCRRVGRALFAAFTATLVCSAAVSAVTLDGSSRSYLLSADSISGDRLVPGYEYLDLAIGDLGGEEFSAHFGGWGRYDFKQETGKTDLQYGYLSYKRRQDNTIVNLGRVMVFEGVASDRVDGIYARTDLAGPALGISAFGGVPAETNIDTPGNNTIYGGRLSHSLPNVYTLGVSYLQERKNSEDFRKETGADLWVRPLTAVELLGRSSYDMAGHQWSEHNYSLVLGPFADLRFTTEGANYHYDSYFRGTTSAAFQLTAGLFDPNEVATIVGEDVSYAATDKITLGAHYRHYNYKIAGNASSYGGTFSFVQAKAGAFGFSVERMDGDTAKLRYTQYRWFSSRTIGRLGCALDLIDLVFDENITGTKQSYSASLAFDYELSRSLLVGADAEYLTSPTFERDFRILGKLIYLFGSSRGGTKS